MAETLAERIMAAADNYAGERWAVGAGLTRGDDRMGAYRATLAALVDEATAERVCRWTEEDYGVWWSDCGEGWCFNDGGPSENSVRFCQGCGWHIELAEEATDG